MIPENLNEESEGGLPIRDLFGLWNSAETAPHGVVILGFFEDIGWKPCAWSECDDCWKVAYCKQTLPFLDSGDAELSKHDEPEWIQRSIPHYDLCWWMPFPPSLHPRHSEPNSQLSQQNVG